MNHKLNKVHLCSLVALAMILVCLEEVYYILKDVNCSAKSLQ